MCKVQEEEREKEEEKDEKWERDVQYNKQNLTQGVRKNQELDVFERKSRN